MGRFIPRGGRPNTGRSKAVWPMLLTCGLLAAALGRLPAQNGDNIRTFYFPSRSFNIPFTLTERDPRIELLLNVSTDRRGYRYVGAARPQAGHFPFTAPADGEYSFIVQTREPNGVVTPADLRTAAPSIRVCRYPGSGH